MPTTMFELREQLLAVRSQLRNFKDRNFEIQVRLGMVVIQEDWSSEPVVFQRQFLEAQRLIEVGGKCVQSKPHDSFPRQRFYPLWHAVEELKQFPVQRASDIGSRLIGSDGHYPPEFDQRLSEFWNLAIGAALAFYRLLRKSDSLEDSFSPEVLLEDSDDRLWLRAMFEFAWDRPDGGSPKALREIASPEVKQPCVWRKCDLSAFQNGGCFFSVIADAAEVSIQLIDRLIYECAWSPTGKRDSKAETRTGDERANSVQDNEAPSTEVHIGHAQTAATGVHVKLRKCDIKAMQQYDRALKHNPELTTDRAAYDWFVKNCTDEGETLPAFGTWERYVRAARAAAGEQKNKRGGAVETRSVVRSKSKNRTKADRL